MIAVQSANIHVSFQCVRMRCVYAMAELCQASGLNYPWGMVDISLTKIDLARQMIQVVNSVSIESIKANGESCVSFTAVFPSLSLSLTLFHRPKRFD
jgi:hypothetical protein